MILKWLNSSSIKIKFPKRLLALLVLGTVIINRLWQKSNSISDKNDWKWCSDRLEVKITYIKLVNHKISSKFDFKMTEKVKVNLTQTWMILLLTVVDSLSLGKHLFELFLKSLWLLSQSILYRKCFIVIYLLTSLRLLR